MELGVLPVVNENDTVAVDEIRFGDNDSLAAMVANLIDADLLVLLTDQDGLYDANPNNNPDARLINEAKAHDPILQDFAGDIGGKFGTGGMLTKVNAAKIAAQTGVSTVIANGRIDNILAIISNDNVGTILLGKSAGAVARKQWLATQLHVCGTLTLDDGAVKCLCESGSSLLPVGVTSVEGDFLCGDLVSCIDRHGKELARGLVNYSTEDAKLIMGKRSQEISDVLGSVANEELIHRDNLTLCMDT